MNGGWLQKTLRNGEHISATTELDGHIQYLTM